MIAKTQTQHKPLTFTPLTPLARPGRTPRWLPVLALLGTLLTMVPTVFAQAQQPRVWITGADVYRDHNGWRQGVKRQSWIVADTQTVVLTIEDTGIVTNLTTRQRNPVQKKEETLVILSSVRRALQNPRPGMSDTELALLIDLDQSGRQLFYAPFKDSVGPAELIGRAGLTLGQPQTWEIYFRRFIAASQGQGPNQILEWETSRFYYAFINENKQSYKHRFETLVELRDIIGHHRGYPVPDISEGFAADDAKIRNYPQ